jgi:hypothetical protein
MSLFEVTDYDRHVYEEELRDFLPDEMIDDHCHVWLYELSSIGKVKPGENLRTVSWPFLIAKDNSIEDLMESYRLMFPGKKVTPLFFPSTNRDTAVACNEYCRQCSQKTGYPALYYSLPEQRGDEIEEKIRNGHFLGLKSYLNLAPEYIPEQEIRIFDFFPKYQLERIDKLGGIVMLHIPRPGRIKDPVNLAQMLEIEHEFPNIRLIIAHIGRAYSKGDIGNAFEVLSETKNMKFDITANTSSYSMTKLLETVGPNRVLFGSDLPILRMRMRRIEENGTYINLVPPGLYGDTRTDPHLREVSEEEGKKLTFFMYEEIRAFKEAAHNVGLTKDEVARVFFNNAKDLIAGARKDIYGV